MGIYSSLIYTNLSWLLFDKLFRLVIGMLVAVWVARYLGPENYGILNYAIAYTSFFTLFVKIGLDRIIVREVVNSPDNAFLYLGTAFYLKLLGSFISVTLIIVSIHLSDFERVVKWSIFLISTGFIFQSLDVIDFYYQSLTLSKYVVFARNISFIICSLLKVFFILNNFNVIYFALVATIEIFISAILLVLLFRVLGNDILSWRLNKNIAISVLKDSWPLALNIFLVSIHVRIDQAMIKSILNLEQLGVFSVAAKLSEYWFFIPAILVQTLMPYFVRLRNVNYDLYEERILQLYSIMFWSGTVVGIITIFFGKSIILILYGIEYIESYEPLIFNIWKGIFVSQALASGIWIINENVQLYRLIVNVLAVLTNIVLNIFLIPKMGISGAGLASLISIGISTWIYCLFVTPLRKPAIAMIKSILPIYMFRRNCGFI